MAGWGTGLGGSPTRWTAGGLTVEGGVEERVRGKFGKCEGGERSGGGRRGFDCHFSDISGVLLMRVWAERIESSLGFWWYLPLDFFCSKLN